MDTRMGWIDSEAELSLVKQCELAGVSRATWYNHHTAKPASDDDLQVCRLIDEEYTRRPFYGSRRMVFFLKDSGMTKSKQGSAVPLRLKRWTWLKPGQILS